MLITAKRHPPVHGAASLVNGTILAFPQGCSYRKRLEDWFGADQLIPDRVLEFASYLAIIACVAAGTGGCAIVTASALQALHATHEAKQHELSDSIRVSRTHLAWNGSPSPAL